MTRSRRPPGKRRRERPAGADPPLGALPDEHASALPPARLTRGIVLADLAIMVGAFAVATGGAEIAGATNLGTSLSFGQIAFALAAFYVLMRR